MATIFEGLIHHVQLNEAGWRETTHRLLLLASLGESTGPMRPAEMATAVEQRYGVTLDVKSVVRLLAIYMSEGLVRALPDDSYGLTEVGRLRLQESATEADELTGKVRARFEKICAEVCPDARLSWETIETDFLRPMAAGLGARVYDLIKGDGLSKEASKRVALIDSEWARETRASVAKALERFINPDDPAIRTFFLRLLNTDLLVRASSVSEADLAAIDFNPSNRLSMTVFVDTNLLFSLMRLHENPADDSAEALIRLVKNLSDRLDLRFVALPTTIDEAKRTLSSYQEKLSRAPTSASVVAALEKGNTDVSGITLKFFKKAAGSGSKFSAREYFGPYLTDFTSVMRGFGVELHNADTAKLKMDQDVIDDILEQQEWEKSNRRPERLKPYVALEHDMILWHFVKRQRPIRVDSPLKARAWIGTIDFRFIGFDEHKLRVGNSTVPLCIHPTTLLQMLQFWVPRSPELEKALVQSLWPLLPHVFDKAAEDVTIKILSAMSRYENDEDLPEETISNLLVNSSLRARISRSRTPDEEFGLVESEILVENNRLLRKLREERKRADTLQEEVNEQGRRVNATSKNAESKIQQLRGERESLADELRDATVEKRLLQEELERRGNDEQRRRARFSVLFRTGLIVVFEILLAVSALWFRPELNAGLPVAGWLVVAVAAALSLWFPVEIGMLLAKRHEVLIGGTFLGKLGEARKITRWLLLIAAGAAIGRAFDIGIPGP